MSFAWLPIEVQACIITQTVQASPTITNASTSTLSRSVVFDKELALALSLVSPTCHAIVASTLYRNIHIAKPSTLLQFSSTFGRYPEFVKAVKSIHIGPDAELPQKGWPLRMGEERRNDWPELFLITSLSQHSDEQLLPRWCELGSAFSLDQAGVGLQHLVIHKAISAAAKDLDVNPRRRRYGISGNKIGLPAWTARLYLLQAALDLYLMEMRNVEDREGFDVTPWRTSEKATPRQAAGRTRSPTLGAYPASKILPSRASSAASNNEPDGGTGDSNTLVLTIQQLWQHIQRRDGPANHFDSAVLLTRCSRNSPNFDETSWSKMRIDLCGPHTAHFSEAEWLHVTKKAGLKGQVSHNDEAEDDSAAWFGEDVYSKSFYAEQDPNIDPLDLPSAGVPEFLETARTVLFSASQATNVSLSGYFARALPALRRMEALRSLNIGPTPGWWEDVGMKPEVVRRLKKNLFKLRVVGKMHSDDAAQICHKLTALEEVEWVWPDRLAGQAE